MAALVRATAGALPWPPILMGATIFPLLAVVLRTAGPVEPLDLARIGAATLVAGLAFVLEDPARELAAACPVPWRQELAVRAAIAATVGAGPLLAALAIAPVAASGRVVLGADVVALGSIAAAVGTWAVCRGHEHPSLLVGPLVLGIATVITRLGWSAG